MPNPVPEAIVGRFDSLYANLVRLIEPWDEALAAEAALRRDAFLKHVRQNLSPKSADVYVWAWTNWVDWLDQLPLNGSPAAPHVIQAFLNWRANQGDSPNTQSTRIAVIRMALDALGALSPPAMECLQRAARSVRPRRAAQSSGSSLPNDFLRKLESTTDLRNAQDVHDTTLVVLLSETLLRPRALLGSQLAGVWVREPAQFADITNRHDGAGVLAIRRSSESGDPESVVLSHLSMKWLNLWRRGVRNASGPLFRLARGGPLPAEQVQIVLRRVGKRTGVGRKLTIRALRKLTAASMLSAGVKVADIQVAFRANRLNAGSWISSRTDGQRSLNATLRDFHRRRVAPPLPQGTVTPQMVLF